MAASAAAAAAASPRRACAVANLLPSQHVNLIWRTYANVPPAVSVQGRTYTRSLLATTARLARPHTYNRRRRPPSSGTSPRTTLRLSSLSSSPS
jgi:hypothetical protein